MAFSKTHKMANPNPVWWEQVLLWLKDNWFNLSVMFLVYRAIDKVFKYASDGRDEHFKEIVKETVEGDLKTINEKLDKLTNSVFEIKTSRK
jgi:hypothetical protein